MLETNALMGFVDDAVLRTVCTGPEGERRAAEQNSRHDRVNCKCESIPSPRHGPRKPAPNTCPRAAGRLPSNFMAPKWIPLESNPDVLNAYATKLGADLSEHSFCDVYGLDEVHSHFQARSSMLHSAWAKALMR